jgi:hypothetical protein
MINEGGHSQKLTSVGEHPAGRLSRQADRNAATTYRDVILSAATDPCTPPSLSLKLGPETPNPKVETGNNT